MARIFITEEEAVEWGLVLKPPKKIFNYRKMVNNVTIRVLAGLIVLLIALILSVSKSGQFASLLSGT